MTMDDDAERKLRERAEARVLWAYNGANLSAPWPIFVTLGWGIGLVAHGWTVYAQSEDRHAAAVEAEMRKLRERDR